jgi:hypothetical protein
MADYAARIATLKCEQAKLVQRQAELAAQRREEIGRLAEKFGALELEDEVLTGMFLELKSAMESDGSRLRQWRDAGGRFRSPKPERSNRHTADAAPHANGADSHRSTQEAYEPRRTQTRHAAKNSARRPGRESQARPRGSRDAARHADVGVPRPVEP